MLKLEYPHKDIAQYFLSEEDATAKDLADEERIKQNTLILGGDAQFDAWAQITDEFPELQATKNRGVLIDPKSVKHNPLRCQVLKIPHHMSKHSISLEVLEILQPLHTIASCSSNSRHEFPHEITVLSVKDIYRGKKSKRIYYTGHRKKELRSGTVVVLFRGDKGEPTPDLANYEYDGKVGTTTPVGHYPEGATPQGLMDMAGNVWEWMGNFCINFKDIPRPAIRGGSWSTPVSFLRCTYRYKTQNRYHSIAEHRRNDRGFRVVRSQL